MKRTLTMLSVTLAASFLLAHTSGIEQKKCPLCDYEFEAEMDMSGTQFGMRLDFKPLGAIAAPWRVAVCPKCHFALYKEQFSDTERDGLRKFLAGDEYTSVVKEKHASYFLIARTLKEMKADHFAVAYAYLRASWQVENDPARQAEYLNACLSELRMYVGKSREDNDDFRTAQLLIGEILRRVSEFDSAAEHFKRLSAIPCFTEQPYRSILEYQLTLIQKRDASPQKMPPIKMTEADIRRTPEFKMLEKSPRLSSFTTPFTVSDLEAGKNSTWGVYFFGKPQWSGDFTPKVKLSCRAKAELIFPIDANGVISVGLSASRTLEALTEACNTPFICKLVNAEKSGRVRLRAAGDRLHWNTEEVEKYSSILKAANIEPGPAKNWTKIILDLPTGGMISMYHPLGRDIYVVDIWLFNNPYWRKQYQALTGEMVDADSCFPDNKYCPIVNRDGTLRLIEKKNTFSGAIGDSERNEPLPSKE